MKLKRERHLIRWIDKKNVGYYITSKFTGEEDPEALKKIQNNFLTQKNASSLFRITIREFDETTAIRIDPFGINEIGKDNLKSIAKSVKELRSGYNREEIKKLRIGLSAKADGTCNVYSVKSHTWG